MPSANGPAELDAVTLDAMGTLVELVDPVEPLRAALRERGVESSPDDVRTAFAAEVAYYTRHGHEGRDEESLRNLGRSCAGVFLAHLGSALDPAEFAPAFVGSLRLKPLPGVPEALAALRRAGLSLACVSNWDVSLRDQLSRAGLVQHLDAVVSSAESRAPKPAADAFRLALDRLGVTAERALHVGDGDADEDGAAAAGLRFEPAPVATLPGRLGLGAAGE
jgi:HAD superfamily hydrolase (TIGR01509 family)